MATGKINVQADNIFPIIKKFLYSDHEIFLREIVSNAVDASQKLKTLASVGDFKGDLGEMTVKVAVDKEAGTITVSDNGIGMTEAEVEKYLNEVAFSGAEDFLKKYEGKAEEAGIIGHFGLGFYSSFMVSDRVEVITKSHKKGPGSKAVKWSCTGSPDYEMEVTDRKVRGTDIVMHIAEDSLEFLEDSRVREILNKYCKFLPVEIQFGTKQETNTEGEGDDAKETTVEVPNIINNPKPAWTKKPADLSTEDYNGFYKELYPMTFEEPMFNIHLNVDYPFNLTGVLYFPRLKDKFEMQRNKIQLYSNQVFVTDSVEGIVPEFLTLLHGVIDSPDIPLNVSRSYLQSDGNVKKISNHIAKKVADKLQEMFKNDRADFETKWDDVRIFLEYGMLTDEKFFDRVKGFSLLKNSDGECHTFEEYKEKIKENQTDKDNKVVVLYTSNAEEQHGYVQTAKDRGYDVLVMDSPLSSHLVGKLEQSGTDLTFTRVDADTIDKLIQKDEVVESNLSDDQKEELKPILEGLVAKENFTVVFESLSETAQPLTITQPEFMRRMKEMNQVGGGGGFGGTLPDSYNLVVNSNHPLISRILTEENNDKKSALAKQATDLALLSQNMLKGENLTQFIHRSLEMID